MKSQRTGYSQSASNLVSRLAFHEGEAFYRVAMDYPTILDVILEQVQNALDVNAKTIWVVLNRKTRHIAIRDDGNGTSGDDFEESLASVCKTKKERGKLGRFGIGLISPLGKCAFSTFTSTPKGKNQYVEWTFTTSKIRAQEKNVDIPRRNRPELAFTQVEGGKVSPGIQTVMWRTEVNIHEYSKDKAIARINSIDALKEAILDRFSAVMRENDVLLNLKFVGEGRQGNDEVRESIRAKKFTGRPLPEVVIKEPDAGKVTFRLFLAPKTTKGQHGMVSVGEADNSFRFPFKDLLRSEAGSILSEEVAEAVTSGLFEGEIVAEKVELHVSRKKFEPGDALVGFMAAIETWFEEHGAKHFEVAASETRDERHQQLGLESLRQLEEMFRQPSFAFLRDVIGGFSVGNVGKGHAPRPEGKVMGPMPEPGVTTKGVHEGSGPGEGSSGGERERSEPQPTHEPYVSAGPKGSTRTLVRGDSLGITFSHTTMDGSDRLWELNPKLGILHFNVSHPIWVECDDSDRKVRQLQETVAVFALMTRAMSETQQVAVRDAFDEALPALLFFYHQSPAFTVGRRKQPKGK